MALQLGFLGFVCGAGLGIALLRRIRPTIGPTQEDWRYAEQVGGRWAPAVFIATTIASLVGLLGGPFGVPVVVRASLLGFLAGFCLPFFAEGIRRLAGSERRTTRS
jgi:hypothetical protein